MVELAVSIAENVMWAASRTPPYGVHQQAELGVVQRHANVGGRRWLRSYLARPAVTDWYVGGRRGIRRRVGDWSISDWRYLVN